MATDPYIEAIFGPAPSDLDLSDELVTRYNIVTAVILGLAVAIVGLRIYVRKWRNNLWWDDYAIVVATVSGRYSQRNTRRLETNLSSSLLLRRSP